MPSYAPLDIGASPHGAPLDGRSPSPLPTRPSHVPWVLGAVAAFFALTALFVAWYTVGASAFGLRESVDFSLWGGCWAGAFGVGTPCGAMGSPGPFNITNAMLPSLVCAVVSFLLYLGGSAMGFGRTVSPRAAGALSLMAAASSLIAPLALMANMGPALAGADFDGLGGGFGPVNASPGASFWGSSTSGGGFMPVTVDWGPGGGWYLSFIAASFGAFAGLCALLGRPGDVPIRPPARQVQPVVFAPMVYGPPPFYGYPPAYPPPAYSNVAPPPLYGYPPAGAPAQPGALPASAACPACGLANAPGARTCAACFAALGT